MCAQYTLKITDAEIRNLLGISAGSLQSEHKEPIDALIVPHRPAPVMVGSADTRVLREMNFSLIPSWSKTRRPQFATHNARLRSQDSAGKIVPIFEKPTWKKPFLSKHCIVPMTAFLEPIYSGELAGNMVKFSPDDAHILLAAGIRDEWTDKNSGEIVDSFAILTDDPYPFVELMGHDRSPVFLSPANAQKWLEFPASAQPALEFLLENKVTPKFLANPHRALRPGWEKRK